jgi:glycosyltransferase involved in cell wall biosynthesis
MISILIPVYNCNIVTLVYDLHDQASAASVPIEIIVLDDCSSELLRDQNKDVNKLANVRFMELEKNIGRASIRNKLAGMAAYPTLLFMDCDSKVPDGDYIKRYLPYCGKEIVVCGGRIYRPVPPDEPEMMLRWLYGIKREQLPANVRSKVPYHSFMTNNFLISRSILAQIQFDESLVQYGHEDTLFGFELKKRGIPVIHIQNPLIHTGLEITREFLRKTSEGIENLVILIAQGKIDREGFEDIRILRAYNKISRFGLVNLYLKFYYQFERMILKNLMSINPNLSDFDLYKLAVLAKTIRKHNVSSVLLKSL